ncbi:glycosyltransferase family 4 protein [Corynebacterium cystitidis]|uniref:Glycosyltransferase involved in cell wall bisynthesis n=1 Tax=Corynebacterium cystitidis DSM 20524 TaxID=1121357 RepID=A0A1H9WAJ4_9CORY|nr:glycosyltransferase family 4 protein [Corynebacterium cystitidis]WJY82948.1 putative glycosyl transferase [Corynebacterium cystitidis DSM 20524]SES30938.1 Glycosyltransferase involved in cell wall bisynthesis [Corynebacterium cystitidis DSM 20524]SNV68719.1 colanic acid biosynthesis glycosyl transferase wcaI [Corynebacterium cystitidis]
MKILVLSQYWYPENGVPQRRWQWLTDILQQAGHEVTVITPPPHYKRKLSTTQWFDQQGFRAAKKYEVGPLGERIVRCGFFPSGRSLTKRIFNQASVAAAMLVAVFGKTPALRDYHPDLIIGTVPALPTASVTWLAAVKYKVPYIIDLRDAWPALFRESNDWNTGTGKSSLREKVLSKGAFQTLTCVTEQSLNKVLGHASGIITTSKLLEEQLHGERKTTTAGQLRRVTTVRNVFPEGTSYRKESTKIVDKGRAPRSLRVLYAGTVGRAQKLHNAIEAARLAKNAGVDIEFAIVGDGASWTDIRDIAPTVNFPLRVEHSTTPDQLVEYYSWADTALVHLTDWDALRFAIPSKIYELFTVGLHISGVVQSEAADLIRQLDAGSVIAPEDPHALAALWQQLAADSQRLAVSDAGRQWVIEQREYVAPRQLLEIVERSAAQQ